MAMVSTKTEAQLQGLAFYYTGVPCTNGHIAPRYTSSHKCSLCCRDAQRRAAIVKKQVTLLTFAHIVPLSNNADSNRLSEIISSVNRTEKTD